MNVDLWVAALRILAAVLVISVVWPNLFEPRRWARRLDTKAEIESHGTFLGDVIPGDEVKFEFKLFYVTFGDSIEYRTEFEWD